MLILCTLYIHINYLSQIMMTVQQWLDHAMLMLFASTLTGDTSALAKLDTQGMAVPA